MDAEISPEQHRLQTCKIVGDLRVALYDGDDGPVATVYGDPDGLRSLATILNDLAALDQESFHLAIFPLARASIFIFLNPEDSRMVQCTLTSAAPIHVLNSSPSQFPAKAGTTN